MAWYAALIRANSSLARRRSSSVESLVVTASGWYSLVIRRKARFTSFSSYGADPEPDRREPSRVDRPRRTYGSLVRGRGEAAYPRAVVLVLVLVFLAVGGGGRDGHVLGMCRWKWGAVVAEPADDGAKASTDGTTARRHSSAPGEAEVAVMVGWRL